MLCSYKNRHFFFKRVGLNEFNCGTFYVFFFTQTLIDTVADVVKYNLIL